MGEALHAWAEARGYRLEFASSSGAPQTPPVQTIAWVSVGRVPAWVTEAGAAAARPGVVVDAEGAEPSRAVSTVGGPGSRFDQAAFMAGVMAGLASRTWVVGLVDEMGAAQDAVLARGFVQGVRYACPRCQIVRQVGAEAAAQRLLATLTDVVFVVPGPAYEEVWQRLAAAEVGAVWVGAPPQAIAAENWVGGVEFDPAALVCSALEALLAGEAGQAWPYSLAQGGMRLDVGSGALSPGRLRLVEQAWQALMDGSLDTGLDPETGASR